MVDNELMKYSKFIEDNKKSSFGSRNEKKKYSNTSIYFG